MNCLVWSVLFCCLWPISAFAQAERHYRQLKAKGLVTTRCQGDELSVERKQFDADSGELRGTEVDVFARQDLLNRRASLMAQVAELDALLAECPVVP